MLLKMRDPVENMALHSLLDDKLCTISDLSLEKSQYLKISIKELTVKQENDTVAQSFFLVEMIDQKGVMMQLLSLMEEQNEQLRLRYIESLQLTIQHEMVTPLKNSSHMISAAVGKIQEWPSKQQRLVTSKLTMVYYQLYQLQNYSENVNLLSEVVLNMPAKQNEFDPSNMLAHTGQIFKTQAEI